MSFRVIQKFELFPSRLLWNKVSRAPEGQGGTVRMETPPTSPSKGPTEATPSTAAKLEGVRRETAATAGAREQEMTGATADRTLDEAIKGSPQASARKPSEAPNAPSAAPRRPEAPQPEVGQTPATGPTPQGPQENPDSGVVAHAKAVAAGGAIGAVGGLLKDVLAYVAKLIKEIGPQLKSLITSAKQWWDSFLEENFPKPKSLIRGPSGESVAAYMKEGFTPGHGIGIEVPPNTNLYLSMGKGKVKKGSNYIVIEQEGGRMIKYTNVDPSNEVVQDSMVTVGVPIAKSHGGLVRYQIFEAGEGGVPKEIDPTPQLAEANLITTTAPEQPEAQPAPGPQAAPTQTPPATPPGAQQAPGNQNVPTAEAAAAPALKADEGKKDEKPAAKKEEKAEAPKKSWWERLWS